MHWGGLCVFNIMSIYFEGVSCGSILYLVDSGGPPEYTSSTLLKGMIYVTKYLIFLKLFT